jgi:hypothetical protein
VKATDLPTFLSAAESALRASDAALTDAIQSCPCSPRERDSGHLVDCYVPRILETRDLVRAALAKRTPVVPHPATSPGDPVEDRDYYRDGRDGR